MSRALDIRFEFANLGGGIGIPYHPDESPVDLKQVSAGIRQAYENIIVANNLSPLKIFMENGRVITGTHGYLVARGRHIKRTFKTFAGVDATMANLMRPALYGAYHHISVPSKMDIPKSAWKKYDVVGSLCENNDKFAVDRLLPT